MCVFSSQGEDGSASDTPHPHPPSTLKFNDSIQVVSISSRNNLIRSQGPSVAIKAQHNPERKDERDMKESTFLR